MSTVSPRIPDEPGGATPLLANGDRMTQAEFHRRYEQYPEDVKFELIGGIVYMASPLRLPHSDYDDEIGFALGLYRRATPGVQVLHGATAILGDDSEPQPDLGLRILPEYGGQSRTVKKYVEGPPELLVEIAYSTRSLDMHQKRRDYRLAGVAEYLVLCVEEQELHWFNFKGRALRPNAQGVYKSRAFPGLWVNGPALLARGSDAVTATLQQGIASPEHADFVRRLHAAHR
jgi:Uma2 family endonuclease